VYKNQKDRYNKEHVILIHEDGKTIYKLYREGKLIYIGVDDDKKHSDSNDDRRVHDERSGKDGRT
jgi:hypothetical protein